MLALTSESVYLLCDVGWVADWENCGSHVVFPKMFLSPPKSVSCYMIYCRRAD